jgi:hypothetical protein
LHGLSHFTWARKIPFQEDEVEIRRIAETEDFGDAMTPELRAQARVTQRST